MLTKLPQEISTKQLLSSEKEPQWGLGRVGGFGPGKTRPLSQTCWKDNLFEEHLSRKAPFCEPGLGGLHQQPSL